MQKIDNLTDSQIIKQILDGDVDAYSLIVERYEAKLMRYATYILKDYDIASDITQETFIKAYTNLRGFKLDKQFSSWIYRILHNEAMNFIKSSKKLVSLGAVSENDDNFLQSFKSDKDFDQKLLKDDVRKCLNDMDVKYREVLMLNYFDHLKYDEISDILRIPTSTVGIRIRRAKISLKKICQQKGVSHE